MPEPSQSSAVFSFSDHVALLDQFLLRRAEIVERIEENLLNVRGKETERIRNRAHFDRLLNDCFFALPGLVSNLAHLKGQLAAAHLADGFEPIRLDKFSIEFDPLDLVIRAYEHWSATRWPGRTGRLACAEVIYSIFFVRQLENFTLRIWDDGDAAAGERLAQLQSILDRLNGLEGHPAFVRDVRWLVQTAQGALTSDLAPYFRIAEHIANSFTDSVRLGLHAAGAKMAGGHLRSQVVYRALETGRTIDDPENLAIARNSNSMDNALLLRDLVGLLKEYERICAASGEVGDSNVRLAFADAILQGISSDIELFVTRLDLLAAATMIEGLFLETKPDAHAQQPNAQLNAQLNTLGRTHAQYLAEYRDLITRFAGRLKQDALILSPQPGAYSPYGISYGFAADLLSNLAIDKLVAPVSSWAGLTLEDFFASLGNLDAKGARAKALAALPKRPGEQDHFYHSAEFAAQIFGRLIAALDARAQQNSRANASDRRDARIYVSAGTEPAAAARSHLPENLASASEHCFTSNHDRSSSLGWVALPKRQILIDRNEGRYLASVECDGEWFAVSKFILTLFIAQETHVLLSGVPPKLAEMLRLTCPGLLAP
jgi:hypothetical protein